MGTLTESMTRLCGEIVALRGARLTFVRDLGQNVAAMKADFRRAHNEMARRTKAERQGFVKTLGHEVASLRAGFRRAHKDMARKTKAERRAAVNHLKKTVGAFRREFALDLAGSAPGLVRPHSGGTPGQGRSRASRQGRSGTAGQGGSRTSRQGGSGTADQGSSRTGPPGRVSHG